MAPEHPPETAVPAGRFAFYSANSLACVTGYDIPADLIYTRSDMQRKPQSLTDGPLRHFMPEMLKHCLIEKCHGQPETLAHFREHARPAAARTVTVVTRQHKR